MENSVQFKAWNKCVVGKRACKGFGVVILVAAAAGAGMLVVLVYVKNQKKHKKEVPKSLLQSEDWWMVVGVSILVSLGKVHYTMHICTHMILPKFIKV